MSLSFQCSCSIRGHSSTTQPSISVSSSPVKLVKHTRCQRARNDKDVLKRDKSIISTVRGRVNGIVWGRNWKDPSWMIVLTQQSQCYSWVNALKQTRLTFPEANLASKHTEIDIRLCCIKVTAGGAVQSICQFGYSFFKILTLFAWLLTKVSPSWEQDFVKCQWPTSPMFNAKATFRVLNKCLQKSFWQKRLNT